MSIFDYGGIIHLHSTLSDGNADVTQIIHDAASANLDFVILTDHDTLAARQAGLEGWHGKVLLLVGYEIAPDKNHYLALGTEKVVGSDLIVPQKYIDAVSSSGGTGIIAHPDHRGVAQFNLPSFAWTDWSVSGHDAMSIWDLMTDWQHRARTKLVAAYNLFFPPRCLKGPEPATLERWDLMNQAREKPLPSIGECDNHGLPVRLLGREIPILPYHKALRMVHTRLYLRQEFTGDTQKDYRLILDAIRQGNGYVAQEWWKSAQGFKFTLHLGDDEILPAVAVHNWKGAKFRIELPSRGRIRLLCNGSVAAKYTGRELEFVPESPGVWRVEVAGFMGLKWRPWIFSNPISLK